MNKLADLVIEVAQNPLQSYWNVHRSDVADINSVSAIVVTITETAIRGEETWFEIFK